MGFPAPVARIDQVDSYMRFFREPLVHFFALGAVIFVGFQLLDDSPKIEPSRIELTEAAKAQLIRQFEATWRREPTDKELSELIGKHLREEILVREAYALGLDQDDLIIRQRLAQKMTFLIESAAEILNPTEADLQTHLSSHPDRFGRPARISFEQIMLDPKAKVEPVLAALRQGELPGGISAGSLLPARMPPTPGKQIDGTFGDGFFAALKAVEKDNWSGPVESSFGRHLVRVLSEEPARLPSLDEIRDTVERDWRSSMREELLAKRLEALTSRYEIVDLDPEQGAE